MLPVHLAVLPGLGGASLILYSGEVLTAESRALFEGQAGQAQAYDPAELAVLCSPENCSSMCLVRLILQAQSADTSQHGRSRGHQTGVVRGGMVWCVLHTRGTSQQGNFHGLPLA